MEKIQMWLRGIFVLAVCLINTGCLNTKVPPYIQNDIITDDKMIGQWIPIDPKKDENPPVYTVIPLADHLYQLLIKENNEESIAQMTLFQLNNQNYMSVSYSDSQEIDTFQYYWEGEALKLKGFDSKAFEELTKREKLDIEYSMDSLGSTDSTVSFNTTTEKLRSFIQKYGAEIFIQKPLEFKRIVE